MCRAYARSVAHDTRAEAISTSRINTESPDLERLRLQGLAWLEDTGQPLAADVANVMKLALQALQLVAALQSSNQRLQKQTLLALGLIAKSEQRGNAQKSLAPDEPRQAKAKSLDPIERLRQAVERHTKLSIWQNKNSKENARKAKKANVSLKQLEKDAAAAQLKHGDDDEVLTVEEIELQEAENLATKERASSGGGADPSMASLSETLMQGASTTLQERNIQHDVDRDTLPKSATVKQTFHEERVRFDFCLTLTRLTINVEKLAINTRHGDTLVSADMDDFGPPKMRVTWSFLTTVAVLASQYVMPFNRLAKLTSSPRKRFTASEISRYYAWVAQRFVDIYIHLGRSLAHAEILAGDDTSSLVLEVASAHKKMGADTLHRPPWAHYADAEKAAAVTGPPSHSISVRLACAFGFAAQRKNGAGAKIQFNTTTLSGRTEPDNPKSTVIFYRSHLGGLGNLLDAILPQRAPEDGGLIIQSDLSTVNLVTAGTVPSSCPIRLAGCSSHARRPFAMYEKQEPDVCDWILHAFKAIPIFEGLANAYGRNETNVGALRDVEQRRNWQFIREQCEVLQQRWSKSTPLGEGARYILRHYDKLTLYLDHPRLDPSNNFSERMLRQEKLIGNNSMFRQSLEGRFSLDIMRTVLQTCVAADVDISAYCTWVMRQQESVVAQEPEAFTPLAFKRLQPTSAAPLPT